MRSRISGTTGELDVVQRAQPRLAKQRAFLTSVRDEMYPCFSSADLLRTRSWISHTARHGTAGDFGSRTRRQIWRRAWKTRGDLERSDFSFRGITHFHIQVPYSFVIHRIGFSEKTNAGFLC